VDINPDVEPRPEASRLKRPIPAVAEPVSIKANVLAAIGTFLFFAVAPTILLNFVPLPDEFAAVLVEVLPMTMSERMVAAAGLALLFVVIGVAYQLWQRQTGHASWWPLVLAFPVTGILLVPDALARGGSLSGWIALWVAIALCLCLHWLAVLVIRELID
jgi:hypothetical protein